MKAKYLVGCLDFLLWLTEKLFLKLKFFNDLG